MYYQNVRGLRSKTISFYRNLCQCSYDIILLTETWLTDSISDTELFSRDYMVWRRDRNYVQTGQSRGGGVLIAIRNNLSATPKPLFNSSAEDLWITIKIKHKRNTINLHLCVLYLCNQNNSNTFTHQLYNYLNSLNNIVMSHTEDKFVIAGDFNLSGISWIPTSLSHLEPRSTLNSNEILLIDELNTHSLLQYNGIVNKQGKILDLVLSNDVVTVHENITPLVPIDPYHKALDITINFVELHALTPAPQLKFFYDKGDYDGINLELSAIDWATEFSARSLVNSVDFFYDKFKELRDRYIPSRLVHKAHKYPPWYTQSLRKVIKEKHKFHRKFKVYGNLADLHSFQLLRDRVKYLEKECYNSYMKSIEDSIEKHPKTFWSYVNARSKGNAVPCSVTYDDTIVDTGTGICNAFSNYFKSTFLDHNLLNVNIKPPNTANNESCSNSFIPTIEVSDEEIAKLLTNLDVCKSPGPDLLPARFLVGCAKTISLPISLLFKRSLRDGTVPEIWKKAFITPVHKKGQRTEVSNYRPISKLSIIGKVFERIIYDQVYAAIKNSLNSKQHGFCKGRSTVSNLVLLNDFLTDSMDNGMQVDVVYTDYSKAFDRISHSLLLNKLFTIGIRGDLLRWFTSYLNNRSQAVVINNYVSSWVHIPSGVPQGSLLGPLLFNIFVNDIDKCLKNSHLLCFADDMKIFSVIESSDDVKALQSDLDRLSNYCTNNRLDLNPSKCSVITFTRKTKIIQSNYTIDNYELSRCVNIRDLGVIHDRKLIFDEHINSIINKASKALGFVLRTSRAFTNIKTIKILYCTYVRSSLEYASQIWNPKYNTYITRLENIQKKFIRYVCFRLGDQFSSSQYYTYCKKHHLLPLHIRRDIADLTYLLKITHNLVDSPELISKIMLNVPIRPLRHSHLLHTPLVSTYYRQNSFLWRVCSRFNKLLKDYDFDLFNTSTTSIRSSMSNSFFT